MIDVSHNAISPEGWARIGELKLTKSLYASGLSDQQLIALADQQPKLQTLGVGNTPFTDAVMEPVSRMPQLRTLHIYGSNVTDAGLASLEKTKTLMELKIARTKVTAAGVAKLQAALPKCKIEWDGEHSRQRKAEGRADGGETQPAGNQDGAATRRVGDRHRWERDDRPRDAGRDQGRRRITQGIQRAHGRIAQSSQGG